MKLALLKGNRFNPWHLQAFSQLGADVEVTAFRAESEIQKHFEIRDDASLQWPVERIYFDTQAGPPWSRLWNEFRSRYRARESRILPFYERLESYDLIQSWELFTDWTAEAVKARERFDIPLALMVWDNIPFNMERDPGRRKMKAEAIAAADRFLVHTDRSARVLDMEGVPRSKVVKIDPGIDTETFCPSDADRNSLGLEEDEFVILFVGWLLPRKGLDFLLMALRELLRPDSLSGLKMRLAIVGAGPGEERVRRLAKRLGVEERCTWLGARPYNEMPGIFRAADLFALPSIATPEWQEQFGMSLLEAMASGVPVVSSLSGAIPEIVGDSGILCQPNDFAALHGAIEGLALDTEKRAALGAAGRERALDRFRLGDYSKALSDIYGDLLSR